MKIVSLFILVLSYTVSDSGAVLVSNVFNKVKQQYTKFQSLDITYNTANRILCTARCLELTGLCYSFIYQPDNHYCELGYKSVNSPTARNMSVNIFEVDKNGTGAKPTDECKTDLRTTSTGEIKSPLYPKNYPNTSCSVWLIQAGTGQKVILKITSVNTDCGFDFLTVYDGGDVGAPKLFRGCSIQKEFSIASSSNIMYITFITDNDITRQGFFATYSFHRCGATFTTVGTDVYSPGYGVSDYPSYFRCSWTFQVPAGFIALVTIHSLATECNVDNFTVYNGNSANAPKIFERCSVSSDVEVYSSSTTLYVTYTSNNKITNKGFYFTNGRYDCDDSRYTEASAFTSIEFPHEIQRVNLKCSLTFTVASDRIIIFIIDSLNLICGKDYVTVYDGINSNSPILFRDCKTNPTYSLASSSSSLYVTYTENDQAQGNGFTFQYNQYFVMCGDGFAANNAFRSPLYPLSYPANFRCSWTYVAKAKYKVALKLQTVDIECPNDVLTIHDGRSAAGRILFRKCSLSLPVTVKSTGQAIYITFTSNIKNTKGGWYGTFSQIP